MKMTKKQKQKLIKLVLSVVVLLVGLLVYRLVDPSGFQERWNEWLGIEESSLESVSIADNGNFSVHMIDVGIGDALLVQCDGKNMLIDAAENDAGDRVLSYLSSQGVKKLDIAVGTHAHSDHIGGLDTVLSKISCDRVYLSDMAEEATPTTKTYLDLLTVISEKKIPVTKAEAGKSFYLGSAKVEILGPRELYDDLNETSIVLKVTYGSTKFLFTGDMESGAEKDLIDAGCDLSADVLKVDLHLCLPPEQFKNRVGNDVGKQNRQADADDHHGAEFAPGVKQAVRGGHGRIQEHVPGGEGDHAPGQCDENQNVRAHNGTSALQRSRSQPSTARCTLSWPNWTHRVSRQALRLASEKKLPALTISQVMRLE